MKFVLISSVLLLCGVSATPTFMFGYQPYSQFQSYPNQYQQVATVQQAAPVQQLRAVPVQQMQAVPVQFYYQNWPQVQRASQEPTVIVITRSKPEHETSHNINVNSTSTSSSVANANNNNSIQTLAAPPPPVAPAASAPVSLQSVVIVSNPQNHPTPNAAAPPSEAQRLPVSARISDDTVVTSAETTTTTPASTTIAAETTTTIAPTPASSHDEPAPIAASAPGAPNLPITLQSYVVLNGQQQPVQPQPSAPTVIAIQDESSAAQPAAAFIPAEH